MPFGLVISLICFAVAALCFYSYLNYSQTDEDYQRYVDLMRQRKSNLILPRVPLQVLSVLLAGVFAVVGIKTFELPNAFKTYSAADAFNKDVVVNIKDAPTSKPTVTQDANQASQPVQLTKQQFIDNFNSVAEPSYKIQAHQLATKEDGITITNKESVGTLLNLKKGNIDSALVIMTVNKDVDLPVGVLWTVYTISGFTGTPTQQFGKEIMEMIKNASNNPSQTYKTVINNIPVELSLRPNVGFMIFVNYKS